MEEVILGGGSSRANLERSEFAKGFNKVFIKDCFFVKDDRL